MDTTLTATLTWHTWMWVPLVQSLLSLWILGWIIRDQGIREDYIVWIVVNIFWFLPSLMSGVLAQP